MAQNHLKFGTYTPPDVDEDGYLKWSDIKVSDASKILKEVMGKSGFDFFHLNICENRWETKRFYAANFNAPCVSLVEGEEKLDELSFQVTSEKPVL